MPPTISVALCTFNRARLLEGVLEDLCTQTLDRLRYEVIVVDNRSTDDTAEVAKRFADRGVRYVREEAQGLSHARNRGWHEAQGEYVAYTDDDCRVPPEWLAAALNVVAEDAPSVFGGPYSPWFQTQAPRWFRDAYGSHDLGSSARALGSGEYLSGGNLFVRRDVLAELGGFDAGLGMSGTILAYGEETALQMLLRERHPDARIQYDPALRVRHLVGSQKMTLRWNIRHHFVGGRYARRVFHAAEKPSKARAVILLARTGALVALDLARGVARDRAAFPFIENYWIERTFVRVGRLGEIWETLAG